MKTIGGNSDLELIFSFSKPSLNFDLIGITQRVPILCSKMGELLRADLAHRLGEDEKVVTKAGEKACRFHVSCIDEEFKRITVWKFWKKTLIKRLVGDQPTEEALFIPAHFDIGKRLLMNKRSRFR